MRRIAVLAILLAAALVAACSEGPTGTPSGGSKQQQDLGGGGGGEAIRIGLPTAQTSFVNADLAVAAEKGFFEKQGVSVKVQNFGSGLKVVQAVIAGGFDVGASSIEPVVTAGARGQPLPIIGAYADRLAVNMVTPRTIADARALAGKRLGIQDVGAFREVMTRLVLQRAKLTPDDVDYRPVESNGYTGALVAGQIQSGILQVEQSVDAMRRERKLHVLADLYKLEPRYVYGTYFAKQQWLARNRDRAVKLLAAITEAHRFMYEHKAETVKIVAEATGFEPAVIEKAYGTLLERNAVFPVNQGLEPDRLEYTVGRMKALGLLGGGAAPDLSRVVDRGPIDAAVEKLGGPLEGDERWR
jgi:NitT/TauT family transport system substrate-binding protein